MKKAFTLIELLVVVLIIGILAAIVVPMYEKAVERSRIAEAITTLKYMHEQAEMCILEHGESWCNGKSNADIGIELGAGYTCRYTGEEEICCNKHWCYINNGGLLGDNCPMYDPIYPIAARVNGVPEDLESIDRLYLLEYEDEKCTGSLYPNQIVCYERRCDFFDGAGQPVN